MQLLKLPEQGRQGKGFAVVAEEIRHLSEEISNATGGIVNIVKETDRVFFEIEESSQETVIMIEQTAHAVQDLAQNSDRLVQGSETISRIFSVVSSSSEELAEMSNKINALINKKSNSKAKDNGLALIEWDDNYAVGVKEIDNQHKQLFNIINDLIRANKLNI